MTTLETRTVRSSDGTEIVYHAASDPTAGPTVVLAGGLGAHHSAWRPQVSYLGNRLRFITWDYRGVFSPMGRMHRPVHSNRFGVEAQLGDLLAVLAAEKVERCSVIGWSAGVRIALEAFHALPGRIESLVLIGGNAGRTFERLCMLADLIHVAGRAGKVRRLPLRSLSRTPSLRAIVRAASSSIGRQWIDRSLRAFGVVGPTMEPADLDPLLEAFATVDPHAYLETLRALSTRDAFPLLAQVDVPTLVLASGHDPLMPAALAHVVARHLPRSEVLVVPRGRHYLGLEFPDLVNLRLERFYQDVGLC